MAIDLAGKRQLTLFLLLNGPEITESSFWPTTFSSIRDPALLGGIGDARGIIRPHGGIDHIKADGPHADARWVQLLNEVVYLCGGDVAFRASRETEDHGEVPRLHPVHGHRQVVPRRQGNVLGTRLGGRPVRATVNAEERKIARVPGPDPVVGVAPVFANGARRCPHEAHIGVGPGHDQELLVPV